MSAAVAPTVSTSLANNHDSSTSNSSSMDSKKNAALESEGMFMRLFSYILPHRHNVIAKTKHVQPFWCLDWLYATISIQFSAPVGNDLTSDGIGSSLFVVAIFHAIIGPSTSHLDLLVAFLFLCYLQLLLASVH